jgi:Tol biopolymer transport system component
VAANGFWYDLWVADADGSNPRKLADMVNSEVWSPDGRSVAYLAPAGEQGIEGKLYVVDVERLESREIATCDLGGMHDLAWLPTDEITCRRDGVIHAIKNDGSEIRPLNVIFTSDFIQDTLTGETLPPVFQGRYFISPDGKKMAFLRRSMSSLWVSNLDGTDVVKVEIEGAIYISHDIAWSPDSSQLAFSVPNGRGDGLGTDLWVVKADGTELCRVAAPEHDNIQFVDPAWSPDGKVLVFTHRVYSDTEYESVWVMNADGTNAHLLVDVAFAPQWSPGGNGIAVLRERVISSEESLLISVNLGQQE